MGPWLSRLTHLQAEVAAWFARAQDLGWLDAGDLQVLQQLERGTPADLFAGTGSRPLVVALFGGTGVGKSSLLNRLAGEAIARVGVERPTSHELTVYVHAAVELSALPERFPLDKVRVARHGNDAQRDVMWVDMPDIDSTEARNRELTLDWLPYVDLLVYVVSPERYLDDLGWRLLRERGHRHGWMFVMNHWDEGAPEQLRDLRAILGEAGFSDPLVVPTCCAPASCQDDGFVRLASEIQAVQDRHGRVELERVGIRAHLQDLSAALAGGMARLGDEQMWQNGCAGFRKQWAATAVALQDGLVWPSQEIAAQYASRDADLIPRLLATGRRLSRPAGRTEVAVPPPTDARQAAGMLWDAWAHGKLTEVVDTVEIALRQRAVASKPLLSRLQQVVDRDGQIIESRLERCLREFLARPGTALQRALRRVTGAAVAVMPLAALLWVAYEVVGGYLQGSRGAGPFLGVNFAINSALLVAVAWLLPYLLHRRLKPSVELTVLRALRAGLQQGLAELHEALEKAFEETGAERAELLAGALQLQQRLVREHADGMPPAGEAVERLLPDRAGFSAGGSA